jgi:phosphoglycerate dehydrogenase-like enzyme
LTRLPNLKLIVSTGRRNVSIDMETAAARGIEVASTGGRGNGTAELTWALILAALRHIPQEIASVRAGGWQASVGGDLEGATLGVVGLGRIGASVAKIGRAFGMDVIAWSQNLTAEAADAAGVRLVAKRDLFAHADIVTLHLVLSARSTGIVGAADLAAMKSSAWIVNTSRGALIEKSALIAALQARRIAGAALDVHDVEPMPADDPMRSLPNVLATPHLGYVTRNAYETFYAETVSAIDAWIRANRPELLA